MIEFVVYRHDTLDHSTEVFRSTSVVDSLKQFEDLYSQSPDVYDDTLELEMHVNEGEDYVTLIEVAHSRGTSL